MARKRAFENVSRELARSDESLAQRHTLGWNRELRTAELCVSVGSERRYVVGVRLAKLQVLVAAVFFACGGAIARGIVGDPASATAIRLVVAGPLLVAVSARRHLGESNRRLVRSLALSSCFFAVAAVASQASFQYTTLMNASLIPIAAPFALVVIELVSGRLRRIDIRLAPLLVLTAALALFIATGPDGVRQRQLRGDLAAVVYVAAFVGYLFTVRRVREQQIPAGLVTGWVMTLAAAPLTVIALFRWEATMTLTGEDLLRCALVAFASTVVGQTLVSAALGRVEASAVARVLLAQPVFAGVLAVAVFGEPLGGPIRVAAGLIVLTMAAGRDRMLARTGG